MKTRHDKNSTTAALEQAQSARMGLGSWPMHGPALPSEPAQAAEIESIFEGIVACRPADAWSGPDLIRCCHLSILLQLQNENMFRLASSGPLSKNKRGTAVVSPLVFSGDKLGQSISSLTRQLGLNAQRMGGDPRTERQSNDQFRRQHGDGLASGSGGGQVITLAQLLSE